jgi:hypothetical protein
MQIQELINATYKESTETSNSLRENAVVIFSPQQLMKYTELIIQHTCEQAAKLEGKNLYD